MKTIIVTLITLLMCWGGHSGVIMLRSPAMRSAPLSDNRAAAEAMRKKDLEAKAEKMEKARRDYVPIDPWRQIGTNAMFAKGDAWVEFDGKVLDVQSDGILVKGDYGEPPFKKDWNYDGFDFFVAGFPYSCVNDQPVRGYVAKISGTHRYVTVMGGANTVKKLEYGDPCAPPAEVVKAYLETRSKRLTELKELAETKRLDAEAKALKMNQDLAEKGDAYGLLRMGERHLAGDGVEHDSIKAKQYLQMSSDQGNQMARKLLEQIKLR